MNAILSSEKTEDTLTQFGSRSQVSQEPCGTRVMPTPDSKSRYAKTISNSSP